MAITPSRGRKRQLEEMLRDQEERRQETGELLSEAAINVVPHAKRKRSKEERVASIKVSSSCDSSIIMEILVVLSVFLVFLEIWREKNHILILSNNLKKF